MTSCLAANPDTSLELAIEQSEISPEKGQMVREVIVLIGLILLVASMAVGL
jgi:hypothetical protein